MPVPTYPCNPSGKGPPMASYSNGLLQEPLENHLLGSTGATSCYKSVRILIPQNRAQL